MGGGNFGHKGNNNYQGQGPENYGQHQGGFGKNYPNNNPNNNQNNNPKNNQNNYVNNKPQNTANNFPKGDDFQNQFCRDFHFGQPCKYMEKCSRKHTFDL